MTITQEVLCAFLAGSLDPTEVADVESWLGAVPARSTELAKLRARYPGNDAFESHWRVPPPNYGWSARVEGARSLGAVSAVVGGWFRVLAAPIADASEREVFVLRNDGDQWVRVAPRRPEDRVLLSQLPRHADGSHRIDLLASGPEGQQRWLLAFPRAADVEAQDLPADDWLRLQIRDSTIPVVSVTVDIQAD